MAIPARINRRCGRLVAPVPPMRFVMRGIKTTVQKVLLTSVPIAAPISPLPEHAKQMLDLLCALSGTRLRLEQSKW